MRLCLLDIDSFDEDMSVIRMFCKSPDGRSVTCLDKGFEPYFYVLPKPGKEKDVKKKLDQDKKVKRTEITEMSLSGERRKFVKVFCFLASDVPKVRDVVKQLESARGGIGIVEDEFEYNIPFYKQYMLSKQIGGADFIEVDGKENDGIVEVRSIKRVESNSYPNFKIMAFHIETLEEDGIEKIVLLSMKSSSVEKVLTYKKSKQHEKYVEVLANEKSLLEKFVQTIKENDIDILIGFNSDVLDMHIIRKRADDLKVRLDISKDNSTLKFTRRAKVSAAKFKGLVHIDLLEFIGNILSPQMQSEVMTLDAVSAELLGESVIEQEYEDLIESWRKSLDFSKMAKYCKEDSDMVFRLGKFLLPQIYELSKLSCQPIFDASRMTYSQLVEWYLSSRACSNGIMIPNQPKWDEIIKRRESVPYVGGFVQEPIAGLHNNIAVLDFRSLYPSIIATFNISPETFNCSDCKDDGYEAPGTKYWFCKRRQGFVSLMIKELIERRANIKARMKESPTEERNRLDKEQTAIKTVANATYGYLGYSGSKWYCRECAEASAAFGRFYIKKMIDDATKAGFTVIYADTDSMFVKSDEDISKAAGEFLRRVNKTLPGIMELNLQGIYKSGIFIPKGAGTGAAKKRYALIDDEGSLTIRGLEKVRSDWSAIAKDTQEEVIRLILGKNDISGAVKYVQGVISKLRHGKVLLKDLALHEQMTKPLPEYKAISPHTVAARKAKERGHPVGEGMVIIFVITKGNASISQRAEPIEDVSLKDVDTGYYIDNQIVPAALRVLSVLGVSEEQLLGGTLDSFLKQ